MDFLTDFLSESEFKDFINDVKLIQNKKPLIHSITNYVAMNFSANALLSIGASPVMSRAPEEVEQMASYADALVLNLGTPEDQSLKAMLIAGKAANKKGIPIVYDPVAVGATTFRREFNRKLLNDVHVSIIRGNASEILALCDEHKITTGVDAHDQGQVAVEGAKNLALKLQSVIIISGKIDYITNGKDVKCLTLGDDMMSKVTAMGCTIDGIVAAFAAINQDLFKAAFNAMVFCGYAGQTSAAKSPGNGSMMINFLDELYYLSNQVSEKYATS